MRTQSCYNERMTRNRALVIGLLLVLVGVALSVWAYQSLPARVPTHWDLGGNVNGYSSRLVAVSIMPVTLAVIWLLILVLPPISPRGFRFDHSASAFYICMLAVIALMVVIHFVVLRAELTGVAPSMTLLFGAIGIVLAVVGSFLGRLKKNFWIGVRTPWTLASDEVWQRTNKLAGQLFVAGGIAIAVASFFGAAVVAVLVAVIAIAAIVSIAYSYILYRRIEGFDPDSYS
jgi:uncharacterized membrane protein